MALEGEQEGETRDEDQGVGDQPPRDGLSDRIAPGAAPGQRSAVDLENYSATAALVGSGPLGSVKRMGSRSRNFAYDTEVFQGENLTYAILTQPSQGWVTDNGDGTFSFDPGLDFRDLKTNESRRISFSYQASDGWSGAETASASLTVTGTADGTLAIELFAAESPSRRSDSGETVSPAGGTPERTLEPNAAEPSAAAPTETVLDTSEHAASEGTGDLPDAAAGDGTSDQGWAADSELDLDTARGGADYGQGLAEPAVPVPEDSGKAAQTYTAKEDFPAWDSEPAPIPEAVGSAPMTAGEDQRLAELDAFVAEAEPTNEPDAWATSAQDGERPDEESAWVAGAAPSGATPAIPDVDMSDVSDESRDEPHPVSAGPDAGGEEPHTAAEPTYESTDLASSAPFGEFQDEQAVWPVDPTPSDPGPAIPDVDLSAAVSDERRDEPYPVEAGSEPDGDDMRYSILAQPPEGQVSATENGEFEFTPGPDFPNLEVGELHQVSFTCEAADGTGATSIVIASLTITGTSEAPEICDVSFRRAHGSGADHGADSSAGAVPVDAVGDTADYDPGHLADPLNPSPFAIAESDQGGTWADEPVQGHGEGQSEPATLGLNEESTTPGLDEELPVGTETRETTAESAAAISAPSSWQPDPDAPADVADAFEIAAFEAGAHEAESDAPDAGGPDSRPQEEAASWQPATLMPPQPLGPETHETDTAGAGDVLDRDSALDVAPVSHEGGALPAAPVEDELSTAPAPGDLTAEMPIGDHASPSELQHAEPEVGAGLDQDLGPGTEGSEGGTAPENNTEDPTLAPYSEQQPEPEALAGSESAILGQFGERQAEPEAAPSHDIEGLFAEEYRGAVAPEAAATPLPEHPDGTGLIQPEEDIAAEPVVPEESAPAVAEPDEQKIDLENVFGAAEAGGTPAQASAASHEDGETHPDRDTPVSTPSVTAEAAPGDTSAMRTGGAADDPAAPETGPVVEEVETPAAADEAEEPGLSLVAADDEENEPAELSDFTLSQNSVVENCEAGTLVGQVQVAGAQEGSRFIFDLQNDGGGRFDINPRTGKVTVADGALLDHAAAESHDILVQVIAHSGVSCRKTLTINVLPAGSGQTAAPKPDVMQGPLEAADTPPLQTQESVASKEPVAPLGSGREIEPLNVGKVDRRDKEFVGVDDVDTMHLDGVAGGPGVGGWSIELTEGEIVETKDDHVKLSKNSSGNVMLHGCPVKVAFQGVERIEW